MFSALLIDEDRDHADHLERELTRCGLTLVYAATIQNAMRKLNRRVVSVDFVLLVMSGRSGPWLEILHELQQAAWQAGISEGPLFLCISRLRFEADFQLKIEQMGARYAFEE